MATRVQSQGSNTASTRYELGRTAPLARGALSATAVLALLRIFSSYSWFSGAFGGKDAKFAPDFLSGAGLTQRINAPAPMGFVHTAANHTIVSFLTGTVVPHASLFAWLIALGELGVGVSLLLGLFTRLGGFFAIVQAATYMLVAGGSGADTIGHNYMLILAGFVALLAASGRTFGLDQVLVSRFPDSRLLRIVS